MCTSMCLYAQIFQLPGPVPSCKPSSLLHVDAQVLSDGHWESILRCVRSSIADPNVPTQNLHNPWNSTSSMFAFCLPYLFKSNTFIGCRRSSLHKMWQEWCWAASLGGQSWSRTRQPVINPLRTRPTIQANCRHVSAWCKTRKRFSWPMLKLRSYFDRPSPIRVGDDIGQRALINAYIARQKDSRTLPIERETFSDILETWCLQKTPVKAILRGGASYTRPIRVVNEINGKLNLAQILLPTT
jgi:hypothetical protein